MEGIKFEGHTHIFGKPEGWSDEDCYGLPLRVQNVVLPSGVGVQACVSCWKPTPEELAKINETGVIWLTVIGGQPPVSITADKPF